MPIDYHQYPDDWNTISKRIRERDDNKCKWCGVENGSVGHRDKSGKFISVDDISGQ